jgi:hypothetical protein
MNIFRGFKENKEIGGLYIMIVLLFFLFGYCYMSTSTRLSSIEAHMDSTITDIVIPDDVIVPPGARLCGRCSGCGLYHFPYDETHQHHYDLHGYYCDDCDHD